MRLNVNDWNENDMQTFLFSKKSGHEVTVVLQATQLDEIRTLIPIMAESLTDCEIVTLEINYKKFQKAMEYLYQPFEIWIKMAEQREDLTEDYDNTWDELFIIERVQPVSMETLQL